MRFAAYMLRSSLLIESAPTIYASRHCRETKVSHCSRRSITAFALNVPSLTTSSLLRTVLRPPGRIAFGRRGRAQEVSARVDEVEPAPASARSHRHSPLSRPLSLRRAYRKKALSLHPDKGGDPELFKEVTSAYEALSDPQKRDM